MFRLELAGKSLLSRGDSTGKGQEVGDLRPVAAGSWGLEWQSQPVEGLGEGGGEPRVRLWGFLPQAVRSHWRVLCVF